jgi:hypothetical protein
VARRRRPAPVEAEVLAVACRERDAETASLWRRRDFLDLGTAEMKAPSRSLMRRQA